MNKKEEKIGVNCVICKEFVKEGQFVAPGQVMCQKCWIERGNEKEAQDALKYILKEAKEHPIKTEEYMDGYEGQEPDRSCDTCYYYERRGEYDAGSHPCDSCELNGHSNWKPIEQPKSEKEPDKENCPYCNIGLWKDTNGGQIFCRECGYKLGDNAPTDDQEPELLQKYFEPTKPLSEIKGCADENLVAYHYLANEIRLVGPNGRWGIYCTKCKSLHQIGMGTYKEDKWEYTKTAPTDDSHKQGKEAQHNWRTCKIDDCEECQYLVDSGIVMCCDQCDRPGHVESDGWVRTEDGQIFCNNECKDKWFGNKEPEPDSEDKEGE